MGAAENKKVIEGAYESFNKGDVAAIIALNTDDAVWVNHSSPASPLSGEHKGKEALTTFFENLGTAMTMTKFDMHTLIAEGDIVVGLGDQEYKVNATGKTVAGPLVHVFTLRDGQIVRFEEFESNAEDAWS